MFTTRTVVVVVCGACGNNARNDEGGELWFDDESAATAYLKESESEDGDYVGAWVVRPDGTLVCGWCVRKARCERDGHQWMPGLRGHYCRTNEPGHEVDERGFCTRQTRMCRCCWVFDVVAVSEMTDQGVA